MSIAAKSGFIADFKTGYLQRALILPQAAVTGGTDEAHDGTEGFATGRLVKITYSNGLPILQAPSSVSATSIGDATHIVAQSDDSLRNFPADRIPVERYTTRSRGILANTLDAIANVDATDIDQWKSVAVYKIVDADDIKIIPVKPAVVSVNR